MHYLRRLELCDNSSLIKEVLDLTPIGNLLDVPSVKTLCEETLFRKFHAAFQSAEDMSQIMDFAVEVLIFAHVHNCDALKKRCLRRLRNHPTYLAGKVAEKMNAHPDLLQELIDISSKFPKPMKSFKTYDFPVGSQKKICIYDSSSPTKFFARLSDKFGQWSDDLEDLMDGMMLIESY